MSSVAESKAGLWFNRRCLPDSVKESHPEQAAALRGLLELESSIEDATIQLLAQLKDTFNPSVQSANRSSLPLLLSRKRMRVYIYNTHANQPPPYTVPHAHAPSPQAEIANGNTQGLQLPAAAQNANPGEAITSAVHVGHPSWTLHIKGIWQDKQYSPTRLGEFFSRILVCTSAETVLFDSREAATPPDELVLSRRGDAEEVLKIAFFPKYITPTFALSRPLSAVCGGRTQLSLSSILRRIFAYALARGLLRTIRIGGSPQDIESQDVISIEVDPLLSEVVGPEITSLRLQELPQLLKAHLLPAKPIILNHTLKLSGDWIDSEQTFDFTMDALETGYNASLNTSNECSIATTACCSLGLDAWLSGSMQQQPKVQSQFAELELELNALEKRIESTLSAIEQRTTHLKLYKDFVNNPTLFLKNQLYAAIPSHQKPLSDESSMFSYEAQLRSASLFSKPWVPRAVARYLQRQNMPLEDQVCKVIASYNIPDPRKRSREFLPADMMAYQRNTKVRPSGPNSAVGTSNTRPRISTQAKILKKKDENISND